jgi:hypothetical protein
LENNIAFNSSKSQFIIFHGKGHHAPTNVTVSLGDSAIPLGDSAVHLGHILSNSLSDSDELERIAKSFNGQFYCAISRFSSLKKIDIVCPLFQHSALHSMVLKLLM